MAAMTGAGRNHSPRIALHTASDKSIVIVHRAEISPKYVFVCSSLLSLSLVNVSLCNY